jgi:diguanylate cyclase (GGDEF)-like protein/PAS domain S-box-containing protein
MLSFGSIIKPVAAQSIDSDNVEKVRLQLKWLHSFQFAGYYAADKQGYYREEGLEVTLKEPLASNADHLVDTVLNGGAEYGVWNSDLLNDRLSGKPVVVLAVIFQHSPYIVLSRKDTGIRTPSDLVGRKVAIGSALVQFQAMLKNEGLSLDSIEIVARTGRIDDIIDGRADAVLNYITDQPHQMHMRGVESAMLRPIDYGINFYGDSLFTSETEIRQNPERVAAFRRASLKGWKYAMSHTDELIELILLLPGVQERGITSEHLHYEAEQMRKLILPELIEIGHINPGRWKHIADTYVSLGMIHPDYSLDNFLYDPKPEPDYTWARWIFSSLAMVLILISSWATILFIFNRRLQSSVKVRTQELSKANNELGIKIIDLEKAEEVLRQYNHIVSASTDLLAFLNNNYIYTAVNAAYLQAFNLRSEQLIEHDVSEIFGETFFNTHIKPNADRCLTGEEVNFQTWVNYPAYGERFMDITYYPYIINENKVLGFVVNARDITEHKQLEDSLITSEQKFRGIFEQAAVGFAVINSKTGTFITINQKYCDIVGYSQEEMLNLNFQEITHPDDLQTDLDNMEGLLEGQIREFSREKKYFHKNGSLVWVNLTVSPLWSPEEKPNNHIAVVENITERKLSEFALMKSEEHLRISQLYGHIGTWEADFTTNQEFWSEVITKELGFPDIAEPTREDFLATIYPDDRPHVVGVINQHLYENKECDIEYRIVDIQGKIRWMHSIGKAEFDTDGKPLKLRGTVQEITARKITEEKLRLSSRVFSDTHEGIIITDAKAIIIDVNPAFCDITGYSHEDAIGKNPKFLSSGKQSPVFFTDMWQTLDQQGHWQGEIWNRKKEGVLYAELLTISSILDEEGNILQYVGLFSDITHSKQQQERLEQMAHYDVLTQLPNRVLLTDRFIQALAHSKRKKNQLAVCFLDLDDFKPINDLHGHEIGDQLLIEVAERIKINIRDEDTVSRQGGDEFILLLGDIESFFQCEKMLRRILESLAQAFVIGENSLSISASIGVSLYPMDDADFDTLMRHADQAMYQAKQAGKNRYHLFNTEQDQQVIQKNIRLKEIQQALSNDEFCLYYQPKVNMATGKVFGAEALIRWLHPEKGLIPPLQFLPVIKETELEIEIGDWVINEALKQLALWNQQDIQLEVSVNISSYHLQSSSFIENIENLLAKYPLVDSTYFQLEILESSALGDLQSISHVIKTCKEALGVNIALDDFGTGYSSLTHLRNLSVNTIKIDQTFIRDILDDPNDYAIIEGVLGLANAFSREVVAEGVETTEQGLMLLLMGCNEAQGYGISRPIPADNIPGWLNKYTPNQEWIVCSNDVLTSKDNKIKIYRLILNQWLKQFEKNILSPVDSTKDWPIMSRKQCFCNYLLKRAKQEQLFEEHSLEKLDEIHQSIHSIADDLMNKYLKSEIDAARDGLKEIQIAFEKMNIILSSMNRDYSDQEDVLE